MIPICSLQNSELTCTMTEERRDVYNPCAPERESKEFDEIGYLEIFRDHQGSSRSLTRALLHKALRNGDTVGKWMIFPENCEQGKERWKIVQENVQNDELGDSATFFQGEDYTTPVICVYVDFTDFQKLLKVYRRLKELFPTVRRIKYKPDVYTNLDIDWPNDYGLWTSVPLRVLAYIVVPEEREVRDPQVPYSPSDYAKEDYEDILSARNPDPYKLMKRLLRQAKERRETQGSFTLIPKTNADAEQLWKQISEDTEKGLLGHAARIVKMKRWRGFIIRVYTYFDEIDKTIDVLKRLRKTRPRVKNKIAFTPDIYVVCGIKRDNPYGLWTHVPMLELKLLPDT